MLMNKNGDQIAHEAEMKLHYNENAKRTLEMNNWKWAGK